MPNRMHGAINGNVTEDKANRGIRGLIYFGLVFRMLIYMNIKPFWTNSYEF